MAINHRQNMQSAILVLDPEDRYARERRVRGPHPRPIGKIRYLLVARVVGGVREELSVPSELLTVRNTSGYDVYFDQTRVGEQRYRMVYDAGTYVVRVESEFYQGGEYQVLVPEAHTPLHIDLEPNYAYPFPTATLKNLRGPTLLRGTVCDTAGRGVAGVRIEVPGESNVYRTDASGQWVLVFVDGQASGDVTVRFVFPDASVIDVTTVAVVQGAERSLTQAGLRGWVLDRAGIALPNVRIQVSGHAGESRSAGDGSWIYCFGLNQGAEVVQVTASSPAGTALTQANIHVQPRAVVVVPTFRFA
jgi:hypothetical protein